MAEVAKQEKKKDHVPEIVEVLRQYDPKQMNQLMFLHFDPFKKKLVLTEEQFKLVSKLYP